MTQPTAIDPNNPFTRNLLLSLVGTIRAQPKETEAEYKVRFTAATEAWADCRPRGPLEQMLAAHVVAAQYAALDCLNQAANAEDPALADKLRRSHATLIRTMQTTMRLLERQQKRPADTAPPPVIEPIPPLRRRTPEAKPTQHPLHRERAPMKDPAEMTDEELEAAKQEIRERCGMALLDPKNPLHRDALELLPEILPGVVVPDHYFRDQPALAA